MAGMTVHVRTRRSYVGGGVPSIIKRVRSNSAALGYNFARTAEAGAKRNVHVITGHLKSSINRHRIGPGHWKVVVGAHYGVYEEYGTRYRPAHPYFRPAVVMAKARYQNDKRKVFNG